MPRNLAATFFCLALAACGQSASDPYYAQNECRRIDLTDQRSGVQIVGAEDIAFDEDNGRLIVSAYDRRATEKAAKAGAPPPQGGVYAVDVDALFNAEDAIDAKPLVDPTDFENGLRPHGLGFSQGEIAFVNRGYVQGGKSWRMTPAIVRISAAGEITLQGVHCAANDVAVVGDSHLFTRDHLACGGVALVVENVLAQKKSGAYFDDGGALIDGVAFANGVAVLPDGFAVAATREKAIHIFRADRDEGSREFVVDAPGAPDNLSVSGDGDIIAALHPSLFRLALNRKLGVGKAGSRIARVDIDTGETELLFNDPKGALFSAATIGVVTTRGLIAGSVTDSGVLVCEKGE